MSATYEQTHALDDDIRDILETHEIFRPLNAVGALIAVLMHTDENGPLMCGGYPAHAYVRKTNIKERALGVADAVIVIDRPTWDDMDSAEQNALLAHELYHLQPIEDGGSMQPVAGGQEGEEVWVPQYEFDDLHRPKFTMRKHDIQLGWFVAIAQLFRGASGECIQAKDLFDRHGQLLLNLDGPIDKGAARQANREAARSGAATAFKDMVDTAKAHGTTVSLTVGDETVTVGDGVKPKRQRKHQVIVDGKKTSMTPDQLVDAIKTDLQRQREAGE